MNESSFAPVPPPLLGADQIRKNGVAVPNKSGIYFIWEGSTVAYVGQSTNLARRLSNHPRLRQSDKISYLCVDNNELLYHEAFYIGICRPTRNGCTPKIRTRKSGSYQKHTWIRSRQYSDGRWGFDDYSSGKRVMVRLKTKQKAEKRAAEIAAGLTNSHAELVPINADELAQFLEWRVSKRQQPGSVYR